MQHLFIYAVLRYGLDPAFDEPQIQDFESMLRFRVRFQIVTGAFPIYAIGRIWGNLKSTSEFQFATIVFVIVSSV